MAENQKEEKQSLVRTRRIQNVLGQLNSLMGQSSLSLYGTNQSSEVDDLDDKFYAIMRDNVGRLNNNNSEDTSSFISRVFAADRMESARISTFADSMNGIGLSSDLNANAMNGFLEQIYRNRIIEQADLHNVSTQLIELQEAIMITRDAIISPDVVEGRMNRTLSFDGEKEDDDDLIPIVMQVENRYKLLDKIKNFIVPFTLEYGNYYAYVVPYSKLFSDLNRNKRAIVNGSGGIRSIGESVTLYEYVTEEAMTESGGKHLAEESFVDHLFDVYMESTDKEYRAKTKEKRKDRAYQKTLNALHTEFADDAKEILSRIEICNDPDMAIPFMEEGIESMEQFMDYYTEANNGDTVDVNNPKNKDANANPFSRIQKNGTVDGAYSDKGSKLDNIDKEFADIKDVYIKMIEPTAIIPLEIMDEVIGYYLVTTKEARPLNGMMSANMDMQGITGNRTNMTFVDEICEKIVRSFDKPFLMNNIKFKRLIIQAVNYYNLNVNRIKFQFIPAEYIQEFKIDEDVDGHGRSMVKKSLFYAKMYQMLLMFKILSVVLYSNDTKVNYVRTSGLRKDVASKVEEIIRRKQSRQINMYDLYNYSTLINKIGMGTEMYVPTGRSNERPIETDILSGQEIQLNTELLEMLKNAYILGSGVPAAIVNYLNEPEFAKVAEQNNSKWNARVVNYQLDFNPSITEFYKKILRWGTNISEENVDKFHFAFQAPKSTSSSVKGDMIDSFNRTFQFLADLFLGQNYDQQNPLNRLVLQKFEEQLVEEQLPSLNIQHLKELWEESNILATEELLKPNPKNNDNGEDLDLGGLENELG